MSRSKWKGPIITNLQSTKKPEKKFNFILSKRNCKITPKLLNKTFRIYNGQLHNEITVSEEMIGHSFGEFVFTRKNFSFPKKKTKK